MRYLKSRDEQFWEGQILGQSDRRAKSHLEVGSPQKKTAALSQIKLPYPERIYLRMECPNKTSMCLVIDARMVFQAKFIWRNK